MGLGGRERKPKETNQLVPSWTIPTGIQDGQKILIKDSFRSSESPFMIVGITVNDDGYIDDVDV